MEKQVKPVVAAVSTNQKGASAAAQAPAAPAVANNNVAAAAAQAPAAPAVANNNVAAAAAAAGNAAIASKPATAPQAVAPASKPAPAPLPSVQTPAVKPQPIVVTGKLARVTRATTDQNNAKRYVNELKSSFDRKFAEYAKFQGVKSLWCKRKDVNDINKKLIASQIACNHADELKFSDELALAEEAKTKLYASLPADERKAFDELENDQKAIIHAMQSPRIVKGRASMAFQLPTVGNKTYAVYLDEIGFSEAEAQKNLWEIFQVEVSDVNNVKILSVKKI